MDDLLQRTPGFKRCGECHRSWEEESAFLADPDVTFLGFKAASAPELLGLFVFSHSPCDSRIAFTLETFTDLTAIPLLSPSCGLLDKQEDYCLANQAGRPCPALCICTFVDRVSNAIHAWPKDSAPT
jgi:hypothetical protein